MNVNEIMVDAAVTAAKTIAVATVLMMAFVTYAVFFAPESSIPGEEMDSHPTYITPPPTP